MKGSTFIVCHTYSVSWYMDVYEEVKEKKEEERNIWGRGDEERLIYHPSSNWIKWRLLDFKIKVIIKNLCHLPIQRRWTYIEMYTVCWLPYKNCIMCGCLYTVLATSEII